LKTFVQAKAQIVWKFRKSLENFGDFSAR